MSEPTWEQFGEDPHEFDGLPVIMPDDANFASVYEESLIANDIVLTQEHIAALLAGKRLAVIVADEYGVVLRFEADE